MSRERPKPTLRRPGERTVVPDDAAAALEARLSAAERAPQGSAQTSERLPGSLPANAQTSKHSLGAAPPPAVATETSSAFEQSGALAHGPTTRTPGRLDTSTPERLNADGDRRILRRKGRMLSDGSRTEARELRRMTIYLPPELGRELDIFAATAARDKSAVVADALNEWLRRRAARNI